MKYLFIVLFVVLFFFTACNKNKISDPVIYNKIITNNVINVQNPLDSLESYLVSIKINAQNLPEKNFDLSKIDTLQINYLYKKVLLQNKIAITNISKIEYQNHDYYFKKTVLKSLHSIDSNMFANFKPLIDTIYNSNNRNNMDLVYAMLKNGKAGFEVYRNAIDTMISSQLKFDMNNKFIIGDKIIKFNF